MIFENFITFMNRIMLFSGYINRATGFPKPLSAEEEKECLDAFQNRGDMEAREKLINYNLRLVAHIVKKYSNAGEADDLISTGAIGLIKAVNTYKPDRKTQLSTYAARCIENEILMLIRVNKKHTNSISLSESLGNDKDGNEISLIDIIPSEEDDMLDTIDRDMRVNRLAEVLMKFLSKREYSIICMRYGLFGTKQLTQREVATQLGISRSYISRLETKALEELRRHRIDIG